MMKTQKQISIAVENTLNELLQQDFVTPEAIRNACEKYNVSEKHIRNIGGWKQLTKTYKIKKLKDFKKN